MKFIIFLLSGFQLLSALQAQQKLVEINCSFTASESDYFCLLPHIELSDSENQTIVFGGKHVTGRNNKNVSHIFFEQMSSVPFILVEMFTTFPNVVDIRMMDIGLTRIQSGAFENAKQLETLYIKNNSQLTVIEANAFNGASKLNYVELSNNSIEVIHESSFNGAENVRYLFLNENRIQILPRNVFNWMKSLEFLYLQQNSIETLDGRVLRSNQNLTIAFFDDNKINQIGRTFLDGLLNLEALAVRDNHCVDEYFPLYESSTIEIINKRLTKCYDNYDKRDNVELYTLELQGNLTISDEDGNVISQLKHSVTKVSLPTSSHLSKITGTRD